MAEAPLTEDERKSVSGSIGEPLSVQDPTFRINTKESAKGFRYYEWTVRGDSIAELTARNDELIKYINGLRSADWKQIEKFVETVTKKKSGEPQSAL